tara:strand:- start:289 stop:519 length:231 start_codon:yes stop_codon:yes gene_type:complete
MRDSKRYNGHANYATWFVMLEIVGPAKNDMIGMNQEMIKEYCEILIDQSSQGIAKSMAYLFMDDVNWECIFESVNN